MATTSKPAENFEKENRTMGKTNYVFTPGKLSIIMDAQAGSSGKGVIGSYVAQHADNWTFACNTFMPQAGHWVKLDDGRSFFYQTLNSCAYQHDKYEKLYIGPGATIELAALWRELEENGVPHKKLGISPITSILQDIDGGYEKGTHDWNGNLLSSGYSIQEVVGEPLPINQGRISARLSHTPIIPDTLKITVVSVGNTWVLEFKDDGRLHYISGSAQALCLDNADTKFDIATQTLTLVSGAPIIGATANYEYRLSATILGGPLAATGTTAHGCGANRARRVLRRKEAKYAKDIPELRPFLCDVPNEIMDRLDRGEAGLLEIAQGFQLSYMLQNMFPFTTSRNCTVAAGLDDMMVAPKYAGNVILNLRTFPIRINSNKFIDEKTGEHLTWAEVRNGWAKVAAAGAQPTGADAHIIADPQGFADVVKSAGIKVIAGNSGPGYHDQEETTWEEVTKSSGSPEPIMEMTSVTKLPRRVFTYSRQNMHEAIRHNATGSQVWLSVNFMNYVDAGITGKRGSIGSILHSDLISPKAREWLFNNLHPYGHMLRFIGTGARTDDKIDIDPGVTQSWPDLDKPPVGIAHKPEKK